MGILKKLFSGRSEYDLTQTAAPGSDGCIQRDAVLNECDLMMVRDTILEFHQRVKEQGERGGGEYVFRQEYVTAWNAFRDDPTIDNAQTLLEAAPHVRTFFESCLPGGDFYAMNTYLEKRGLKH